jgi:triosephosphate isomerase
MTVRRPIMAANWKMHKTRDEADAFTTAFLPRVRDASDVDVVIAPPFPLLDRVAQQIDGSAITLAAQNVSPEAEGAFTGEVSSGMLADLGCAYGILGHSERRALYGESDELVARKARALLERGIRPIVCIGESLAEREAGRASEIVTAQLEDSLAGIDASASDSVVVAYEPVWAIGTGRTATPEMAGEMHARIREGLCGVFGASGESIRIQYGGSVKPENVYALMQQPEIDGALVGGASLDPEAFARIVRFREQGGAA